MTRQNRLWLGCLVGLLFGGAALAEEVSTAAVLGKVHHANQTEIAMGKMAQNHGLSRETVDFGKVLVRDHTAADQKVTQLAAQEKINLAANTPPLAINHLGRMRTGSAFDDAFAKEMLKDHDKAVAELTAARDATSDPKLKALLTELLPVLKQHQETAQKLVDQRAKTKS